MAEGLIQGGNNLLDARATCPKVAVQCRSPPLYHGSFALEEPLQVSFNAAYIGDAASEVETLRR